MTWYLTTLLATLSITNVASYQSSGKTGMMQRHSATSPQALRSSSSNSDSALDAIHPVISAAQKNLCVFLLGSALFMGNAPNAANAIDPSSLKQYVQTPGAGIDPTQLKKYTDVQEALDAADIEYNMLKSGTSYREFREGRGTKVVGPGSIVSAEMTIRAKSLATAKDPGGVKFYDTKVDTPDKLYTWEFGSGEFSPAVEEALVGMKRSAIRRVELPSQLVFKARANKQLPVPSEKNEDGNRYYKRLFKTDATVLIEVLVTKIGDPVAK